MTDALVTVIIPAHNAADTIARAIASVQAQSFAQWELWVIDDASTDATASRVTELADADARIQCHRLPKSGGQPALPRNAGIDKASGRYLAFLDADDCWHEAKLERQLQAMRAEHAALSCTGFHIVDPNGRKVTEVMPPHRADYHALLRANTIGCSTAMLDTAILGKRHFPAMGHEDYALWLSVLREGHTALGLTEPLAEHHRRNGSASANKLKTLRYLWRIYRREGFSHARALAATLGYAWRARKKYSLRS